MHRPGDDMPPPFTDPTAAAWRVYADWLSERGERRHRDWLKALRYALGLTRRPRLVLVGATRFSCGRTTEAIEPFSPDWSDHAMYGHRRWWTLKFAVRKFVKCHLSEYPLPATPLDFPGMANESSELGMAFCREFVRKAAGAAGVIEVRDGIVCEWVKRGANCEVLTPVAWEAEGGRGEG